MAGGRQLKSRREKARMLLGKDITLIVKNDSWDKQLSIKSILYFKYPDEGYFLKGSDAKIPLAYAEIFPNDKLIELDLSDTLIQSPQNYLEAQARWH